MFLRVGVTKYTKKNASRQRHVLSASFKAPLPTPLEPLSASTVRGTKAKVGKVRTVHKYVVAINSEMLILCWMSANWWVGDPERIVLPQ